MLYCPSCGGRLRRVHRTLPQKLLYAAMYKCGQCHQRKPEPHWFARHLGDYPRCPHCGTYRLRRLARRDKIDAMEKGFVNLMQRLWGGNLYHCRFCRVQFYDVRKPVAPEIREYPAGAPAEAANRQAAQG